MISHVHIGITNFQRAFAFYAPLMELLGLSLKFNEPDHRTPWAGWKMPAADRPLFLIGRPYNLEPAQPGNGPMTALLAPDRETVDRCYALAISLGGTCEGPPGLRLHYHPNYYGAYFRDLDGNKLCVCCHFPES